MWVYLKITIVYMVFLSFFNALYYMNLFYSIILCLYVEYKANLYHFALIANFIILLLYGDMFISHRCSQQNFLWFLS